MTAAAQSSSGQPALRAALSGALGPDALRQVACQPLEFGLAPLLEQSLHARGPLPELTVLRSKYKPGRGLTAYYRVQLKRGSRALATTWSLAPRSAGGALSGASGSQHKIEAEASRRGLRAPFTRLSAADSASSVSMVVSPADAAMPQLVRLHDLSHLDDVLLCLTGGSSRLGRAAAVRSVRYRPGQRHVLRVDLQGGPPGATVFVKVAPEGSGARAVEVARELGPPLAAHCRNARLCTPVGYVPVDRASLWEGAAGRRLSEALTDDVGAAKLVSLLGAALRFIHDYEGSGLGLGSSPPSDGPQGARSEAVLVLRAAEHIDALVPAAGRELALLSDRVLEQLEGVPVEEPRLIHGDAKCDNVVTDGRTICLLDLDRVRWADPALDLGKLLADLRWWSARSGRDVTPWTASLVEGYGPCDPARWSRARLLAVLFQLKLTARRTPLHADGWTGDVRRGIATAAADLKALGRR